MRLFKANENLKVNISLILTSTIIGLYFAEIFFEFHSNDDKVETFNEKKMKLAKKIGVSYDTRSKFDVIKHLKKSDSKTYFNIYPYLIVESENNQNDFIKKETNKNDNNLYPAFKKLFPLGGISNSTTIFDNELGYYPIINLDEHGFNNPKGQYKKKKIDIVLIGDSFVEGYSVGPNESIGSLLRREGLNVVSLGKAGNETLMEFATLTEYAKLLKPKIVLWFYFRNDLYDLDHFESWKSFPILGKYLSIESFTQNLISRQEEIDSLLINFEDSLAKQTSAKQIIEKENDLKFISRIIKLYNTRKLIGLYNQNIDQDNVIRNFEGAVSEEALSIFKLILNKSNSIISSWGGELYFIYLPSYDNYKGKTDYYRDFVIRTALSYDIPVIDIKKEIFDKHSNPLTLFPFGLWGHYNAETYEMISNRILIKLKNEPVKFN
jgi:hypothetical protein